MPPGNLLACGNHHAGKDELSVTPTVVFRRVSAGDLRYGQAGGQAVSVLAPTGDGGEQAKVTSAGDGLGPAVGAELGVQVADVGLDGVPGDRQFGGDLLRG